MCTHSLLFAFDNNLVTSKISALYSRRISDILGEQLLTKQNHPPQLLIFINIYCKLLTFLLGFYNFRTN